MRVITMSRILAALSAVVLAGACNDAYSPSPPAAPTGGGITVVPRSATIRPGQIVALKASLTDEFGDRLDGFAMSWKSSNDVVATVASTGEVLGRSEGHVVITASTAGKYQTSTVHVLAKTPKPGPN
jgi:uncharacterized protein YjdB